MNKKTIAGIVIASILIVSMGIITILKPTLGDDAMELPGEEEVEKILGISEENERGESAAEEAREHGGK